MRLFPPLAFALAFAVTFLVAIRTSVGLHDDAFLFHHVSGNARAPVRTATRAVETIDVGSLAVGIVLVGLLGRARRGIVAAAVVVLSLATAEGLKHGLPHLGGLLPVGRAPTFPSGHTSIAASLGLAVVIAVPAVLRPLAAIVGAAYAAGIGLALVVLAWHFPSDVVGSFCIAGFWASVGAALVATPSRPRATGLAVSAVAVAFGLLIAALLAVRHPAAVESLRTQRALVATAAAIGAVSVATFAAVAGVSGDE